MLKSLSKAVYRTQSAAEIAPTITRAALEAMTCPRGPVSVEIPIDFQYTSLTTAKQPASFAPGVSEPERAEGIARAAELVAAPADLSCGRVVVRSPQERGQR